MNTHVPLLRLNRPEDDILILFNGELWNHRTLAADLGINLASSSEITIIRAAYVTYGEQFIKHLKGMFAIVVVDIQRDRLYSFRDHFGIKPLFYYVTGHSICIASTISSIATDQSLCQLNPNHLINCAVFGFSDYHDCILKDIHQLPPGAMLRVAYGRSILQMDLILTSSDAECPIHHSTVPLDCYDSAQARVLLEATKRCVTHTDRIDRKNSIILLLSGGIDSTLLGACIKQLHLQDAVRAFFIGSSGSPDVRFALEAAKILDIDLTILRPDLQYELEDFQRVVMKMDAYPALGLHSLFRQLREHCPQAKIVLCGEGADELYGGYPWHASPRDYIGRLQSRFLHMRYFYTKLASELMPKIQSALDSADSSAAFDLALDIDRTYGLVERHLLPFDYAGMAFGFEVRVPFLDPDNAAFVRTLPTDILMPSSLSKSILRRVLKRTMPEVSTELLTRSKIGFPMAFGAAWRKTYLDFNSPTPHIDEYEGIPLSRFDRAWYQSYESAVRQAIAARRGERSG